MSASAKTPNEPLDDKAFEPALAQWLALQLGLAEPPVLQTLGGDAGFRRYYRLSQRIDGQALLGVYAPPSAEKNREFVALAQYFQQHRISAPHIHAVDYQRGFLLLQDLGEQHLFDLLSRTNVDDYYDSAQTLLLRLQAGPRPEGLPDYDGATLLQEMELLRQWFIPKLLGYTLGQDEQRLLDQLFAQLQQSALEQPQALVHRDYHSRNIMLGPDGLALIDFQDALWGPISYDLVSLLRDCYVYWPERQVANWVEQYRHSLAAQCNITLAPEQWQRWFDWMGLQRHIKVLGIFARLYLRDGKAVYLDDLPLVIRYCLSVAERYPETSAFAQWFKQTLLPLCQQQPWYRDYKRAGEDGAHLERE